MKKKQRSLNVFFAGELFNLKHLIGNAYLAEAIYEKSHGRYLCVLPQDFDPRGTTPRTIRDHHIRSLVGCDLALFSFDGPDLDSGTLAEFMIAKFADIPSVILRSDRRGAGARTLQWNPMANYYPRTAILTIDGLGAYKAILKKRHRKLDEVIRLAGPAQLGRRPADVRRRRRRGRPGVRPRPRGRARDAAAPARGNLQLAHPHARPARQGEGSPARVRAPP